MKFRGIEVKAVTVTARYPHLLDEKLNQLKDIYDLQFSSHCYNAIQAEYSALVLVVVKKDSDVDSKGEQ